MKTEAKTGIPGPRTAGPSAPPEADLVRRGLVIAGLVGVAIVHLLDLEEKLEEAWFIGVLFIGLIAVCLVLAEMLVRSDDVRVWSLAGAVCLATIIGYALSRTVGLPTEGGAEKGEWLEHLGIASLLVEAIVVWSVAVRLAAGRQNRAA